MDSFDDLLEFNAALVEDEMDYAYYKEHYLDDNSSLCDEYLAVNLKSKK